MAVYEYSCRCGARPTRFAAMGSAPSRIRCPVCRRYAARRFSAPSLRTETTLTDRVRRSYAAAGYKVESWKEVAALEKNGECGIVNKRDLDLAERRQGKAADDLLTDAQRRIDHANQIEVYTGKRRRKAKVA